VDDEIALLVYLSLFPLKGEMKVSFVNEIRRDFNPAEHDFDNTCRKDRTMHQ
jgi:hypothetical protein